jgi:hypothetical protein
MSTVAPNFMLILHLQSAEMNLRDLAECALEMERMLQREQEGLRTKVEERASKIEDEELRTIYIEDASEEWTQLTRTFPEFVRSALFTKSMSAFETYLLRAAQVHLKRTPIALTLGDLRGDGIFKAKLYFTKVAALPFPQDTDSWSDLSRLAEIRNYVVHADSVVPTEKVKGIQDFVSSRFQEIEISTEGRLRFTDRSCGRLIDICEVFLKEFRRRLR